MKTLYYRRHSIKDGPNNTIGPKGLELALHEGQRIGESDEFIDSIFHGPLVRTAQTALAFTCGLMFQASGLYLVEPKPIIEEIGTDELFAQIATPEWREATQKGRSNLEATLLTHPAEVGEWIKTALKGVKKMFDAMNSGEYALGFGHSPIIELAAFGLVQGEYKLGDLEGLVFTQDEFRIIRVTDTILVEK